MGVWHISSLLMVLEVLDILNGKCDFNIKILVLIVEERSMRMEKKKQEYGEFEGPNSLYANLFSLYACLFLAL